MKKIIFIFIVFLTHNIFCLAQNAEEFTTKISYKLDYVQNINDSIKGQEYFNLYINDKQTMFLDNKKRKRDSLLRYRDPAMSFEKFKSLAPKPEFEYIVIRELYKKELIFIESFINFDLGYIENLDLAWLISDKPSKIHGFSCFTATTTYAGRDYVAWFTPEIPISSGPYKFGGLPGLILKIEDTQQHFVFNFIGLENLDPTVRNDFELSEIDLITKSQFLEQEKKLKTNFLALFNQAGITIDLDNTQKAAFLAEQRETYAKNYNPIERND